MELLFLALTNQYGLSTFVSTNVHVAQRGGGGHYSRSGAPGSQGVALVVDNVGKTKLDAHNFVDNSSIFIIKKIQLHYLSFRK